ncbi:MAG: glycosyltransferase family 4 protein [Gemmatimonadales bacterium]
MNSSIRPGILLIGNYPPPFGGAPKHLEDLVPHLVGRGWDVHVLSGGTSGIHRGQGFTVYKDARSTLPRRLGTAGFLARAAIRRRGGPAFGAARMLPLGVWVRTMTRVSLAAEIIAKHDIRVISAYNLLLGAPVGAIAAEMYGLPLVVTNLGEIYSHRAAIDRQLPIIRHIAETATVLTSLTSHCARSYRELGITRAVRVLHYGIDRERFADAAAGEEIRKRFGIPPSSDVVFYLGRLVRDMGLHVLLDGIPSLLARRPATHVLIAGGSGELHEAAKAAVSRWPGRVGLAVDVPEGELASYYAAATLVVAPTIGARACGSLASAEAMAAGKPVVASRIGGIPEYVSDGITGLLVPPGDADALVNAVIALLEDRSRLSEFGRRGRVRVAELFDGERTNAAIEGLFREVTGLR